MIFHICARFVRNLSFVYVFVSCFRTIHLSCRDFSIFSIIRNNDGFEFSSVFCCLRTWRRRTALLWSQQPVMEKSKVLTQAKTILVLKDRKETVCGYWRIRLLIHRNYSKANRCLKTKFCKPSWSCEELEVAHRSRLVNWWKFQHSSKMSFTRRNWRNTFAFSTWKKSEIDSKFSP